MEGHFDIAVIGGGIAGLSLAAELAPEAHVVVLEAEDQPGYHATGRSAAIFAQNYGNGLVRALTAWSAEDFGPPGEGVLSPRGLIRVAEARHESVLRALYREMAADCALTWLGAAEVSARVPLLRPGWAACGFANDDAADMDVAAIMMGHANRIAAGGGRILTGFRVDTLNRASGGWAVGAGRGGRVTARLVVDAAGAWADEIADLAGAAPIGLQPTRRSAVAFDAPAGVDVRGMPMVVDAEERFYLKPEGRNLMASPCDEASSAPCDSRPEEIDVAVCIDRIERAFDLAVSRPKATWSGLRTFSPDTDPVCGWDSELGGFYWLAGQGGYGVQTAPALARIAADDLLGRAGARRTGMERVDLGRLSPDRFSENKTTIVRKHGGRT